MEVEIEATSSKEIESIFFMSCFVFTNKKISKTKRTESTPLGSRHRLAIRPSLISIHFEMEDQKLLYRGRNVD
nr:hypothetical protein CFP56_02209 [Quercus suber]